MKKKISRIVFRLCLLAGLVFNNTTALAVFNTKADEQDDMIKLFESYHRSILFRTKSIESARKLLERVSDPDDHIRAIELEELYEGAIERTLLNNQLNSIYKKYASKIKARRSSKRIIPLFNAMILLASDFVQSDNYLNETVLYQSNNRLRHILNEFNETYQIKKNHLKKIVRKMFKIKRLRKRERALEVYHRYKKDNQFYNDDDLLKLDMIIMGSDTYKEISKLNRSERLKRNAKMFLDGVLKKKRTLHDFGWNVFKGMTSFLFKLWGVTSGQLQWKKGIMNNDLEAQDFMAKTIKPLDVFFHKIRNRATDFVIPGFWGHNAIWIGSEEQLRELGIWGHENIRPLHSQIQSGHSMVESIKHGVIMQTIPHMFNVDDMALIRHKTLTRYQLIENILRLASQVGKRYDYQFNIETGQDVVCSEVIYTTFVNVDFSVTKRFGRWTINPEDIAQEAFPRKIFEPVLLFFNGKQITDDLTISMEKITNMRYRPVRGYRLN